MVTDFGSDDGVRDRSAILHVESIRAPTLIMHGAQDDRAHPGQVVAFHEALVASGADARMVMFPDSGHFLTQEQVDAELLPFLRTHLGS